MQRSVVFTIAKLILASVLIVWLIRSGQLDFSQLERFTHDTVLVIATLSYYIFCSAVLATWRWKVLLQGSGFTISFRRAVQLQLTGLFFNSVMPGAVGGDIIKIAYVIRDNPHKPKTQAMMTALLDRIVGLSGLFLICWIMICFNLSILLPIKGVWPIMVFMSAFSVGFILFFTAALYHYKGSDPFLRILHKKIPGLGLLEKCYSALRIYRHQRKAIIASMLISMAIQGSSLLLFYFMASRVLELAPDFGKIAAIYPVGVLTTAIPLTPGGLGVGHVAFEQLFAMMGLTHGANVFNLFVLSQLALNLLGVIPYLSLRKLQQEEASCLS